MYRKPYKFRCKPETTILTIESVVDKLGGIWYAVEYVDTDQTTKRNIRFAKLSSVIDFISSNF